MREIKFKAFIKSRNKVVDVIHIDYFFNIIKIKDTFSCELLQFNEIELLQYTGLEDKYGNEIYDGAILEENDSLGTKWIVEYDNGKFIATSDNIQTDLCEVNDVFEVVGNIYESE